MEITDTGILIQKLSYQGLNFEPEIIQDVGTLLDLLFKILLQDKGGVTVTTKLNVAAFIESEASELFTTIADLELTFATFKNVFSTAAGEDSALLQGQALISITTILVAAVDKWPEEELELLFSDHLNFLLALLKQSNNSNNVYARSIAATCLMEMELCFPNLLRACLDLIYVTSVAETSVAHQQYMSLLALVVKHSLMNDSPPDSLWGKHLQPHLEIHFVAQNVEDLSFSDLNQIVSFLMDHLPLCTCEGMIWIATQLISMMLFRTKLQASAQVLKPLLLNYVYTYNVAAFYILLALEKNLGSVVFQDQDRALLLHQLFVNSSHPALPPSTKLIYLNCLCDFLTRRPQELSYIASLLPGCFDGPETQLKKLQLLSSLVKNVKGSSQVLFKAAECIQKQIRLKNSVKLKSALTKTLFKYLSDKQTLDVEERICRALLTSAVEDATMAPFVLNFVQKVREKFQDCSLPSVLLTSLVAAYTKPDSVATLSTLHYVIDIFHAAVLQSHKLDHPKAILAYLMKYVMCDEVCEVLNWRLGHQILWLCYNLMKEYDTISFFHELCDVLKAFMSKCEDVDQQDRAQLYYALLCSLSNKKLKTLLKAPKQNISGMISHDSSFHSSASIQNLNKPLLRVRKLKSGEHFSRCSTSENKKLSADILPAYREYLVSTAAETRLLLRISIECVEDFDEAIKTLEAVAIYFTVPGSWGQISPIMVGHLDRRRMTTTAGEQTGTYTFSVACFPIKPHPTTADIRAEFSIEGLCHANSLEPMTIQFSDFFCPFPISDDFKHCAASWRSSLFEEMWQSNEQDCSVYNSVHVIHCLADDVKSHIQEQLASFLVGSDDDDELVRVGIFLPPSYHLLMTFQVLKERTVVKMMTDDLYVLAFASAFLQSWK